MPVTSNDAPVRTLASPTVQLLAPDGTFAPSESAAEFLPYFDRLTEADYRTFYRDMVVVRKFDTEAANLQRQGQLALWVPSHGQEAAQVGSARATRTQDHVFPSYREHVVGTIRGLDMVDILRMLRGVTLGGWTPEEHGNFHLYTLVLASQTLHATGYAMGMQLDGATATGNPDTDQAVIVYYGDGASSQGDANEALVFAASYQTPQVFFLQNNHWAISVPVSRQSRSPLYLRAGGFGMPGIQVDGNDVLPVGREHVVLRPGGVGGADLGGLLAVAGHPQGQLALALQVRGFGVEFPDHDHVAVEIAMVRLGQAIEVRQEFGRRIRRRERAVRGEKLHGRRGDGAHWCVVRGHWHRTNLAAGPDAPSEVPEQCQR